MVMIINVMVRHLMYETNIITLNTGLKYRYIQFKSKPNGITNKLKQFVRLEIEKVINFFKADDDVDKKFVVFRW